MKYTPKLYAQAFTELAAGPLSAEKERGIIKNFLELVERNGDWQKIKKILAETERLLREKTGRRKVAIETARPLKETLQQSLKKLIQSQDIVEKKIDPELVAGVKIILNDEKQFDGSLTAKLQKIFNL